MVVGNLTPMDSTNYIYICNIFNIHVLNDQNTMDTVALVGISFILGICFGCCILTYFEGPDDYFLD